MAEGGGGGGGYDPCECIWDHEYAMRRLISILRHSQSYCTDNECLQEIPGPVSPGSQVDGVGGGGSDGLMLLALCWVVVAVALFFMRPASMRRATNQKPHNNHQGPDGPDAPPAVQ